MTHHSQPQEPNSRVGNRGEATVLTHPPSHCLAPTSLRNPRHIGFFFFFCRICVIRNEGEGSRDGKWTGLSYFRVGYVYVLEEGAVAVIVVTIVITIITIDDEVASITYLSQPGNKR